MNYVGYEQNTINDVMHYGRLGMKWYKHIYTLGKQSGDSAKKAVTTSKMNRYYHKGVRKMQKLEARGKRYAEKGQKRLDKSKSTNFRPIENYHLGNASSYNLSSYRAYRRQNKIARMLTDTYSDVPLSDMKRSDVAYVKKTLSTSAKYKKLMEERAIQTGSSYALTPPL